ncbi:MAG: sulfatase-like hydrolase/transferase, partial [Myxococcota bacterium]|nr:sulfatase-like hydrolase/transferase [Myxococcota bacterium]
MLLPLLLACIGSESPHAMEGSPEVLVQPPAAGQTPSLVVILIDTLREDALLEARTPHIDALRASGSASKHAWSSGTWTVPSIMSLFTGKSVREHGWDEPSARLGHYPIMGEHMTLAEQLSAEGFETTGFYANPYLAEDLGMERGFRTWKRSSDAQIPHLFERLVREEWSSTTAPQFAYLHLMGPHSPLNPSQEARERWGVEDTWFEEPRGLMIGAAKRNRKSGVREAY